MFKYNQPIRIKYEIQLAQNKILFTVNSPCREDDDWSEIDEFPCYKKITDYIAFIGEFEETTTLKPEEWPKKKQNALKRCLLTSQQFCFAMIGHTDPEYVFTCADKAIAVHRKEKTSVDDLPFPFNFIPIEANGKLTDLQSVTTDLFLPTPDGGGQIEWIGDAMESEYQCGNKYYTKRVKQVAYKRAKQMGIL